VKVPAFADNRHGGCLGIKKRLEIAVFIRADAKLPYSRVMEMIDIAKGAGVEVLGIIPEYFTEEEM